MCAELSPVGVEALGDPSGWMRRYGDLDLPDLQRVLARLDALTSDAATVARGSAVASWPGDAGPGAERGAETP